MVAVCTPGVVSSEKEQETGTLMDTSEMTWLSEAVATAERRKTRDRKVTTNKAEETLIPNLTNVCMPFLLLLSPF